MTGFYVFIIVFLLLVIFVLANSKITVNCIPRNDDDNKNITSVVNNKNDKEENIREENENKDYFQTDDYINYFFSTSKADGRYNKESDVLILNGEIYRIVLNGKVVYPWE